VQPALNSIQPDRQPPLRTGAQPGTELGVQLSLIPDLDPARQAGPPPVLPDASLVEAAAVLTGMIAQAAKPLIAGVGNE
jgi:hypothetical protein